MLDKPQIIQSTAQLTAVIRLTIPRDEIRHVMGPGLAEIMSTIAAQGITPAGPWFSHHLKMNPDIFDLEISVPVTSPITAIGRVRPGELQVRKVARANYYGPYEGLSNAWSEFSSWINSNGYVPDEDLWECYVTGPDKNPDPATWRTELNCPLVG